MITMWIYGHQGYCVMNYVQEMLHFFLKTKMKPKKILKMYCNKQ